MAVVRMHIKRLGDVEIEIEISATMRELEDYQTHNTGHSHALAHRINDAIWDLRRQIETRVEKTVQAGTE